MTHRRPDHHVIPPHTKHRLFHLALTLTATLPLFSTSFQFPTHPPTYQTTTHLHSSTQQTSPPPSTTKNDPEWKFFDTARLHVTAGHGGNGCVAFRREKGEPRGGPSGGRGGRGGNILFICDKHLNTLASLRNRVHVRASSGKNGSGKSRDGSQGEDIIVPVPQGTIVRDSKTRKLAGELRDHGETLLVARGGRGGRGNKAFMTARRTAPRIAERGEPGGTRWLSIELRLLADVGLLGKPNAGKSTLLAAATNARPKIADYPFTTIVPNLGVCDLSRDGSVGLLLCDIPGLIEGAAGGAGLGLAFLRHVHRCKVLLHVVDGTSEDPVGDFKAINKELGLYDSYLAKKPQVVVLNKIDVPEVKEREEEILNELKVAAGHTRLLSVSAATTERVKELMGRLNKFVEAQVEPELPPQLPEIDFSKAALDTDSDDFEIISDPAYPNQYRISGTYIEQIAKMTHWEYPEAVERFGRQLEALGISQALQQRGATDGDLIMIDEYDFEFMPGMTNPYIPPELLLEDESRGEERMMGGMGVEMMLTEEEEEVEEDLEELIGFNEQGDWDLLEEDFENGEFVLKDGDEKWMS